MPYMTLTVDSVDYRVRLAYPGISVGFEIVEGDNSGVAQSGKLIRSIAGTGYTYKFHAEPDPRYPEDFDALFDVLSAPVASHRISMPYGQGKMEFDAAIYEGSVSYHGRIAGAQRWKGLDVECVPLKPQRGVI